MIVDGAFDRADALARLGQEPFDVLVVGGGVTGAGVALDAASRGLRTALVERDDFAAGTSSKSSKLVHGGLRYLQQREFRLVYENLAERQRLLDNAPHLVTPLPFLIPLFGRDGAVSRAVVRSYATALWLYDLTGGIRIGSRHRRVSSNEALGHLPGLKVDRLVAGFVYYDARADDARLTLTLLRTAALDHGAVVVNARWRGVAADPARRTGGWGTGPPCMADGRHGTGARGTPGAGGAGRCGGQCHRSVGGRPAGPGPRWRRPVAATGQGGPPDRPRRPPALRHRRRDPGAGGPPVDLRRALARR